MNQVRILVEKSSFALREGRFINSLKKYLCKRKANLKSRFGLSWRQEKIINSLRVKLRSLGLEDFAEKELCELVEEKNISLKKAALWELVVWNANKEDKKSLVLALEYIDKLEQLGISRSNLVPFLIMKSECLYRLGRLQESKDALKFQPIRVDKKEWVDLQFAKGNVECSAVYKVITLNKIFRKCSYSAIEMREIEGLCLFDRLNGFAKKIIDNKNLITVLVPVYNSEKTVSVALNSLLNQTWKNLEIIVIDDCSLDKTVSIVESFKCKDNRVKLIKLRQNGGPYIARNEGLKVSNGVFVTCHDADDWSHPERISIQAKHLIKNPNVIANTSEQVRATPDLEFHRRGKPGVYVFQNMSSLMFRRKNVMEKLGYWDSVRFGADSEFVMRLRIVFGENAFVQLSSGPLALQRQAEGSLTTSSKFGFPNFFMGARKEYRDSQNYFYTRSESLRYDYPLSKRPFPVPYPMLPNRETSQDLERQFDVIIASDFRLDGGSTLSSIEEINAQARSGLKTGLVQLNRYDYPVNKKINFKIREILRNGKAEMLVYGEKVKCDTLLIRYPPSIEHQQRYIPNIKANEIKIIVNQTPLSRYDLDAKRRFLPANVERNIIEIFGKKGRWYPIGPLVRNVLNDMHFDEISGIDLHEDDWVNIINLDDWKRKEHLPQQGHLVVGRHSRDSIEKWPENVMDLKSLYPDIPSVSIKILGGAQIPLVSMGSLPNNWIVYQFGEIEPAAFLSELDVYIYYTHSGWVESFGRVILEAMAVGVPVILPPFFEPVFGPAAIYSDIKSAFKTATKLVENKEDYLAQVECAHDFVRKNFSYEAHLKRLGY